MKRDFKVPRPTACSVDGCGKLRRSLKGFCESHYRRWKAHGDPQAGGTMRGAAQRFFIDVVLTYDGDACLPWPFSRDQHGYGQLHGKRVHRLACEHEHGPPPTPEHQAAHECGKGSSGCVAKGHVSWKTPVENEADKVAHGTALRGEKLWMARLTEADVHRIRVLTKNRVPQKQIASEFAVTTSTISGIKRGESWAWLPSQTEG